MSEIALTSRDQSLLKKKIYNKVRKLTKWDSENKVRGVLGEYRKLGEKAFLERGAGLVFDKKEMEPLVALDRIVKGFEEYVGKNCRSECENRGVGIRMKEGERVSFGRKMESLVNRENFSRENIGKIDRMLGLNEYRDVMGFRGNDGAMCKRLASQKLQKRFLGDKDRIERDVDQIFAGNAPGR